MRGQHTTSAPARSLVGVRLDGCPQRGIAPLEILEEIARGRFGAVHRIRGGGRDYAVKVLDAVAVDHAELPRDFRREAALLASVDHPGLPRVHEVGLVDGHPYLVMDLVPGRPLAQVIAAGPLPPDRALRVATELADALACVHQLGLVHRDVTPDNIVISDDGSPVLIDFGLATHAGADDAAVGTLLYASPEQAGTWNRAVDARADLYSLGVVLYECLVGAPPFRSTDTSELLRLHARAEPPDPALENPDVPAALSAIVTRLMAKEPDDRYPGAADLARDLRAVAAGSGCPLRPGPTGPLPSPATRLVGRQADLSALRSEWERARSGRGAVVVVSGSPGSGKSHLVRSLADEVRAEGALVLTGKCDRDDAAPLDALRTAIEASIERLVGLAPDERRRFVDGLASTLDLAVGLLPALSPALAAALELPPTTSDQDHHEQFPAAVAAFLAALARASGALLLHLDDVQWVDDDTVRVVRALATELPTAPLLVVMAARADDDAGRKVAALRAAADGTVTLDLTLRGLSAPDTADLVAVTTGGMRLDERSAGAIALSADGNPFTVLQYLGAMIESGALLPSWGRWLMDDDALHSLELPLDAAALILTRLEDLDRPARRLLSVAAALGSQFDAHLLSRVSGLTGTQARGAFATAVRRGVLRLSATGHYRFVHDRIREALLATLTPEQIHGVHDVAADLLDAQEPDASTPDADRQRTYAVAAHCRSGTPGRDPERLYRVCTRAGELALTEHLSSVALDLLTCAWESACRAGPDPDAAFLSLLGTAQHRAGHFVEAAGTFRRARDVAAPGMDRATVLDLLARVHDSTWSTDEQAAAVDAALAELGADLPAGRVRLVVSTLAWAIAGLLLPLVRIGYGTARGQRRDRYRLLAALHEAGALAHARGLRPTRALVFLLRGLWAAHRLGTSAQTARIRASLAHLLFLVGLTRGGSWLSAEARGMSRILRDPRLDAYLTWVEAFDWYSFGLDQGERLHAAWSRQYRWLDSGAVNDLHLVLCWDAVVRGDMRSAEALFERRRHLLASTSDRSSRTADHPMDAALMAMQGRVAESTAHLEAMSERAELLWARTDIIVAGSIVAVELDQPDSVVDDLADELDRLGVTPQSVVPSQRAMYAYLAHARLEQARTCTVATRGLRLGQARDAVALLRSAANTPLLTAHAVVAQAQLHWVSERPDRALAALDKGAPALRAVDAPLIAHGCAVVRARACRSLGLRGEADRAARQALAIAVEERWPLRQRRTAAEFGLLEPLGRQSCAPHIGTSVTAERLQQRLAAVEGVAWAASQVVEPAALTRIALDETIRLLGAERAFLFLCEGDPSRLRPSGGRNADGADLPVLTGYTTTLVDEVRRTRQARLFTGADDGPVEATRSAAAHGLRSVLVAPMELNGRLMGVVYLDSRVARGIFAEDDVGVLTTLSNHVAIAFENARAAQLRAEIAAAQRERDVADALRASLVDMSHLLDPEQVTRRLLENLRAVLRADAAWWVPADADPPDPVVMASPEDTQPLVGLVGAGAPRCVRTLPDAASWIAVPLVTRSGRIGLAVLASTRADAFAGQTELATAMVAQGMVAYENAALFSQVQTLATTDGLTGVATRRHVLASAEQLVDHAEGSPPDVLVMMVDVDHFKKVNDTYGHRVGDVVLREVAGRLSGSLEPGDLIGRYGGEEFLVVVRTCHAGTGERIRRAVAGTAITTSAGPLRVTVSVGATDVGPGETLASALERADGLLYRAKEAGRDRVMTALGHRQAPDAGVTP